MNGSYDYRSCDEICYNSGTIQVYSKSRNVNEREIILMRADYCADLKDTKEEVILEEDLRRSFKTNFL